METYLWAALALPGVENAILCKYRAIVRAHQRGGLSDKGPKEFDPFKPNFVPNEWKLTSESPYFLPR